MFCNHGLADTWEWLLLWPWDPKLDNFRIGEHTFSEGAGGLKPKTVYRSTFNIGKAGKRPARHFKGFKGLKPVKRQP